MVAVFFFDYDDEIYSFYIDLLDLYIAMDYAISCYCSLLEAIEELDLIIYGEGEGIETSEVYFVTDTF